MRAFKFVSACLAVSAAAFVLPAQAAGTWATTLLGRDINRQAVDVSDPDAFYLYDTTLDVTWLRNANANGAMNWFTANAWANSLATGSGTDAIDDWRLPTMTDTSTPGCNFSYGGTDCGYNPTTSSSEMASLYFNTLGNKSLYNTSGIYQPDFGLKNVGSFQNMRSYYYWLGAVYDRDYSMWEFDTITGLQTTGHYSETLYAMAVRRGDVLAAVPEPETYAMMLTGLALVGALSRRRSRAAKPLAL